MRKKCGMMTENVHTSYGILQILARNLGTGPVRRLHLCVCVFSTEHRGLRGCIPCTCWRLNQTRTEFTALHCLWACRFKQTGLLFEVAGTKTSFGREVESEKTLGEGGYLFEHMKAGERNFCLASVTVMRMSNCTQHGQCIEMLSCLRTLFATPRIPEVP